MDSHLQHRSARSDAFALVTPRLLVGAMLALQLALPAAALGQDLRPTPATSTGTTAPQKPSAQQGANDRLSATRPQREAPTIDTRSAAAATAVIQPQEAGDYVRFDPPILEYGDMVAGVAETGTVKIFNTGDEPLLITSIRPGCGCTTTNWTKDPIAPGEFGEATFTLKPPERQGIDVTKHATFIFDGKSSVRYSLHGKVVEYIRISPEMVDAPAADETFEAVIDLTSVDGTPFRILSANPPIIDDISDTAGDKHTVRINWEKWVEAGRLSKLAFTTDHPKAATLSIMVKRSIRDLNRQPQPPTTADRRERIERADTTPPLIQAVKTGDVTTARLLIANGADVNAHDAIGGDRTALHWAVREGKKELVPILLGAKANIEAADRQGKTALTTACESSKDLELVRILLDNGANVNARDQTGGSPLLRAAGLGTPEMVQLLVSKGAEVNVIDLAGLTPLLWASAIGNPETVTILVKAGAEIDVADKMSGDTALMRAARTGRIESLRTLLAAKAQVNARNHVGMTPFMLAATSGSVDKLKTLKEAGADIAATDVKGWNALDHARNRVDSERAAVIEYVASIVPESGAPTATAGNAPAAPATRPIGSSR